MKRQSTNIASLLSKLLCVLMAFHLFNLSMDSKDANPNFVPEDLSRNDIESISEFVTEVVLGVEDSFAEHDESDDESENFHNLLKDLMCSITPTVISLSFDNACIHYYVINVSMVTSLHSKIIVPPPQSPVSSLTIC